MIVPSKKDFLRGVREFEINEKNDPVYRVSTYLLNQFWGSPSDMADALAILLLTWNRAFYRFGVLSVGSIDDCIRKNMKLIESFRPRSIFDLKESDRSDVEMLFGSFLDALGIMVDGKIRRSPVGTAKALHLLAPDFLPIWDEKIAIKYGCRYSNNPEKKYFKFCGLSKDTAEKVRGYIVPPEGRTLLKLIDEYNYAKFTKGWI